MIQCEVHLKKRMIWLDKERERNVLNLLSVFSFLSAVLQLDGLGQTLLKLKKDLETQPSFIHNHLLSLSLSLSLFP